MPRRIDTSQLTEQELARVVKQRALARDRYWRNRERVLATNRAWRDANPERVRAIGREWKAANPERAAASRRASYERHRDAVLARQQSRDAALCDATVKSRFVSGTGLQSRDVPLELVPIIRTSMLIRRELRAKKDPS